MSHWLSLLFCFYAATIICIFIAMFSGGDAESCIAVILVGAGIDIVRRRVAPELQAGQEGRCKHIKEGFNSKIYSDSCRRIAFIMSGFVYYLWFLFFFIASAFPAVRDFFVYGNMQKISPLALVASKLYPNLGDRSALLSSFATEDRINIVTHFVSLAWWFLLIGLVLEICGGAFYSWPAGIQTFVARRNKNTSIQKSNASSPVVWIVLTVLSISSYFSLTIAEVFTLGVAGFDGGQSRPVPYFEFMQALFVICAAILLVAFFVKLAYTVALRNITPCFESIIVDLS